MKLKNRKVIVILTILTFFLMNAFAFTTGVAKTIEEDAVFNLDKEDPEGYGAIIPSPNTVAVVEIDGSNQGKFTVTDWEGNLPPIDEEIVSYPGEDISLYYPTDFGHFFFGHYWPGSFSNNNEIDPWSDIGWLNISAYNAEAETLSPFTVSTIFDYYTLGEGGVFTEPFNYERPMQIDLIVKSTGPKVLKLDWLTDDPSLPGGGYIPILISPSGKIVDYNDREAIFMGSYTLYNYLIFTASEVGAYRLIVVAYYTEPASLNLEFLDTNLNYLPLNTIKFAQNFDDLATLDVTSVANWQSNWFRFTGSKGDVFNLDIYMDFFTGSLPTIDVWTPCGNGYLLDSSIGLGRYEVYFPKSGAAYVSFTDVDFEDWYRYSLFLTKPEKTKLTLGENVTSYSISKDEKRVIEFSLSKDSIVRFNYTSLTNPPGMPVMEALGDPNAFIYMDSKELECYDINTEIYTTFVDSTEYFWHYMPAGTYRAVIRNSDDQEDGIFQIGSQVYECSDESIPVNSLTYPIDYPSEFLTTEFLPDDKFTSLKDPVGLEIEIPDIGQFRLNTSIWAIDNLETATCIPSHLYTYNETDGGYYSLGYPQPAFSTDGVALQTDDYLYIGFPSRWTGMTFSFSTPGIGGTMDPIVYNGGWAPIIEDNDGTSELTADGTIEFDITDGNFIGWDKGTGGLDIDPNVVETDYYWMRLDCSGAYSTTPMIQQLTLLNCTIEGDLRLFLIGESGYEFSDYWWPPTQPSNPTGLEVSLDDDDGGSYNFDTWESSIIQGADPESIGFEGGTYKLLIIPENWDYSGPVKIQFAVEDFWNYRHQETYDITTPPNLHINDIWNYTINGYSNITGSIYDYDLVTHYNHTEAFVAYTSESYFAIECTGDPYQWTQLVVFTQGVTDYELYILQDLPWIDPGVPNGEVTRIGPLSISVNRTYEFGAFSEQFTLLFEVSALADTNISFYIALNQYDTELLITPDIQASYRRPIDMVLVLAIVIPAAVGGAIVVLYILKKKGRILTKTPS